MVYYSNSIKEAFKNGDGDCCFFHPEFGYIFKSRHIVSEAFINEMETKGHKYVDYDEVLKIDKEQNPIPAPQPVPVMEAKTPKKFVNWNVGYNDGYYDEYPDAYGQSL